LSHRIDSIWSDLIPHDALVKANTRFKACSQAYCGFSRQVLLEIATDPSCASVNARRIGARRLEQRLCPPSGPERLDRHAPCLGLRTATKNNATSVLCPSSRRQHATIPCAQLAYLECKRSCRNAADQCFVGCADHKLIQDGCLSAAANTACTRITRPPYASKDSVFIAAISALSEHYLYVVPCHQCHLFRIYLYQATRRSPGLACFK